MRGGESGILQPKTCVRWLREQRQAGLFGPNGVIGKYRWDGYKLGGEDGIIETGGGSRVSGVFFFFSRV